MKGWDLLIYILVLQYRELILIRSWSSQEATQKTPIIIFFSCDFPIWNLHLWFHLIHYSLILLLICSFHCSEDDLLMNIYGVNSVKIKFFRKPGCGPSIYRIVFYCIYYCRGVSVKEIFLHLVHTHHRISICESGVN